MPMWYALDGGIMQEDKFGHEGNDGNNGTD
jgi:hypothetical protein